MSVLTDLRYALRSFLKQPLFTIAVIVTLGLGIGANTAIFSVIHGVLLRPLPLPESERLVLVQARSDRGFDTSVSIPNYFSWEEMSSAFEAMGASRFTSVNLTGTEQPERLQAQQVLGDFFGALGRPAHLGRVLTRDETLRGAERQAVVSYGFWQRSLGGSSDVVGRSITLDGQPFDVIGVMPQDFYYPTPNTEIWLPMGVFAESLPWENRGNSPGISVIARREAGVSVERAISDMEAVGKRVQADTEFTGMPRTQDLRTAFLGPVESLLFIVFFAVTLVLLIACTNVAGLLLARSEGRRREVALRCALGAGRGRVMQQLLTESVLLGLLGGAVGIVLAFASVRALVASLPGQFPLVERIEIDPTVLGYSLLVSLATGIVFGLVPAWQASKVQLEETLREGGRGGSGGTHRLRSGLVSAELGLALVLLIFAGLLLRSFTELQRVDPGFHSENVLNLSISLPSSEYDDVEAWSRFYQRLVERVATIPGVQSAAVNNGIPLAGYGSESGAIPDSRPLQQDSFASCLYQIVSPDYFQTLGIPLLQGRIFDSRDREERPLIAIIDESMAHEFWPDESPIGRRVAFEFRGTRDSPEPIWREVVGVVGHVRHYELRSESRVEIYVPTTQPPIYIENRRPAMALYAKADGEPTRLVAPIRAELAALDPNLPIYDIQTMDDVVQEEVGNDRVMSSILTIFAGVALLLASVGVYGVIAYAVSQRTREIGLRMALGARASDVVGMVLKRSMVMTGVGLAMGLVSAAFLSRYLGSFLFDVSASDPATFGGITVLLIGVALLASYLPARRASRVEPTVALRYE